MHNFFRRVESSCVFVIINKIFKNMSSRAAEMMREDLESKGPVKLSEVEANQKEMLQFISAQSFREGISRGSRQHLFRFAREYADYLSLLRKNISIDILDSIDKEIQEHYSENLTLQGLGKKYYINSAYLGQIFRKKYGQSFKNYLCSYRINEACRQLLYTNKQIGHIAEDVGYKDVDYFLCKFIELKGCTPSHFRKSKTEKPHSEFPGK